MSKFFITKEELEILYFKENLSYAQIEDRLNLKRGRIYFWFKKYKIKSRTYSDAGKGRVFSEEHRSKISKSNSKPHTEERKKKISKSHLGKKIGNEHKEKIRNKFIGLRIGNKHPMWRGGLSTMRNRLRQSCEYRNWRKIVYERDNYICQLCNSERKYLNCHHIETFSSIVEKYSLKSYDDYLNCEILWSIDNGITLCKDCHDSIKGKEKENEEKFKNINYEKKKRS